MARKRIAIVEDQTIFRELLVEMLTADGRYDIVAEASSSVEAIATIGRLPQPPDILLLDVILPDGSGLDLMVRLERKLRRTRVLLVTASERAPVIRQALEQGVHGIIAKSTPLRELRTAIDAVAAGSTYYCPAASAILRQVASSPIASKLTPRERQIVKHVASGLSSKEIAHQLGLSFKTVSNHRLKVMQKTGARNVAALTRYAIEQGIIAPDGG